MLSELKQSYSVIFKALVSNQSILSSSNLVLTKFENPKQQGAAVQRLRASYGQAIYERQAGKNSGTAVQSTLTGIQSFPYNASKMLSAHFNVSEFRCKCGQSHSTTISMDLVNKLEELYRKLDCSKIIVTSGYRCPAHDKAVGGNGSGQHTKGTAADVKCYNQSGDVISSKLVSCVAQDLGFGGIANITKAYQAIHLDVRTGSKYYGNEVVSNNTVTKDFYSYYGIKRTGSTAEPAVAPSASIKAEPAKSRDNAKAGTYYVIASSLNVRCGAGIGKQIITTIPHGTEVTCYGYFTAASGVDWLLVETTYKGSRITGYVSSEWLERR